MSKADNNSPSARKGRVIMGQPVACHTGNSKLGTSNHSYGPTGNVQDRNHGPNGEKGIGDHGPTGNVQGWNYGPTGNIQDWNHGPNSEKGTVLRLGTPNSISTDLVVFLFVLYLIRLTYDSHAVPMLLFSFHIMPHAHLTSFISVQCMAMSSLLWFHSATAVRLPHALLLFHSMAMLDARFYLMLLGTRIF